MNRLLFSESYHSAELAKKSRLFRLPKDTFSDILPLSVLVCLLMAEIVP